MFLNTMYVYICLLIEELWTIWKLNFHQKQYVPDNWMEITCEALPIQVKLGSGYVITREILYTSFRPGTSSFLCPYNTFFICNWFAILFYNDAFPLSRFLKGFLKIWQKHTFVVFATRSSLILWGQSFKMFMLNVYWSIVSVMSIDACGRRYFVLACYL